MRSNTVEKPPTVMTTLHAKHGAKSAWLEEGQCSCFRATSFTGARSRRELPASTAVEGLAEGDAVALPTDLTLREGETVTPVYP